jgi:hypothetical protein
LELEPLRLPWDLGLTPEQFERVCHATPETVLELAADGHVTARTPSILTSQGEVKMLGSPSGSGTRVMRTPLTLDDDLAETLNRTARQTGQSFKAVVNAAIPRELSLCDPQSEACGEPFVVQPQSCGLMPGIDPMRFNQLLDQLDVDRFLAAQAPEGEAP